MKRIPFLAALALTLTACGDPIHPQQVIEKTRVLGARVELDGEPERASPEPGEAATARFLVVAPGELPELGWTLAVCPRLDVGSGVPECAGDVFANESGSGTPELRFTVPGDITDVAELLVLGLVCAGGVPEPGEDDQWPPGVRCSAGSRSLGVTLDVPLAGEGERNFNPDLSDDALSLAGEPWPAAAAPAVACAMDGALQRVRAGAKPRIELSLGGGERDVLDSGEREALSIVSFSTTGELDRAFSIIEADEADPPAAVSWTWEAPRSAPDEGRIVRFYFVARDGRAGSDWIERALCLVP